MRRRDILGLAIAAAAIPAFGARGALALDGVAAQALVQETLDQLIALTREAGTPDEKAPRLRAIIEKVAAVEQIARFAAGPDWRRMSEDQQARYTEAFVAYFSRIYSRRFEGYAEPTVTIDGTTDAGNKGILVRSRFLRNDGPPVSFEWLVSDRTGELKISDIVVEGVSTAITQRNEIEALIGTTGDIDTFIDRLATL